MLSAAARPLRLQLSIPKRLLLLLLTDWVDIEFSTPLSVFLVSQRVYP